MEILAGLIQLDKPNFLPAPWFNRPSLGLVTNTPVRVGVLSASDPKEAPPEIIVTPLRTDRLHCTASVIIDLKERTGAVYEALNQVKDLNIALAETVTINQRTRHRITLVLEPAEFDPSEPQVAISKFKEHLVDLKSRIRSIDGDINIAFVVDENTRFEKQETSTVEYGAINIQTISEWFLKKYAHLSDRFDFSRVVASSNAEGRYIRYIFPRKGVFEATVSHLDVPTALARISSVFHELNYNILLSRLSRSVGKLPSQDKSIYVAICEPLHPSAESTPSSKYAADVAENISEKLDACNPAYQFVLQNRKVSLGVSMDTVAYPYRHGIDPGTREIHAQHELRSYLDRYKLEGKKAIFISYTKALQNTTNGSTLRSHVIEIIRSYGLVVFDGFNLPGPLHEDQAADVRARMWMASAAIFFAYDESQGGNLSSNQLIEWGYINGQAKQWAVIVRAGEEGKVKHFMTPDRSFITFKDLQTRQDIEEIGRSVSDQLSRWFLKSS